MKLKKALAVAALGGLAYLYLQQDEEDEEAASNAGTSCGPFARKVEDEDGQFYCEPKLTCKPGFVLSQDMTKCYDAENPCGPGFRMDDDGECQITDDACGDRCLKLNAAKDNCIRIPNCGSATGSDIGDVFLYFGEAIVAGVIYDALGRRVMKVADRVLEREATRKASLEASKAAANKAAGEVAKGGAKGSQRLATKTAIKRLASKAGELAARRGAIQVALVAAKKLAQKIAVQLAKIATLSSTGIGILATPLMILSTSLSVGMSAAGVVFEVPPGYTNVKQWDDIPEGAQIAITSLPVIGDIIDMIMPYIFFTNACAPGLENQNELCYPPPEKGWRCEAFLCTPNPDAFPDWHPENFIGTTMFHLTKKIITDTGTIPNTCPPGQEHGEGGAFCYDTQREPGHIVLGTWWENCRSDERDDLAFCAKEHIDPCGPGEWEAFGRECYGNRTDYIDDCSLGWDSCKYKTWNALKCKRGSDKCSWGCYQDNPFSHCGGCEKRIWTCDEYGDWDCNGGCRSKPVQMPELRKTFAARHFRLESRPKASRVLAPHDNICVAPRSQNIAGLCYPNDQEMPSGYRRKAVGFLEPNPPTERAEWSSYQNYRHMEDIGVSYQLPTYTRPPFPKIGMFPKRKVVIEDPPPPEPIALCSTLAELPPDHPEYHQRVCRDSDPPSGYSLSEDGILFYKKCRDLFTFNLTNGNCDRVDDNGEVQSYPNLEGLIEVEYSFK